MTGVERNRPWSQLQMLTRAPSESTVDAHPPTWARASRTSDVHAGPSEVGGADQPVVARSDDDRAVVHDRHSRGRAPRPEPDDPD